MVREFLVISLTVTIGLRLHSTSSGKIIEVMRTASGNGYTSSELAELLGVSRPALVQNLTAPKH